MNKKLLILLVFMGGIHGTIAQSVLGKWRTVDDETGETKAIVEVFEQEGKTIWKSGGDLESGKKKRTLYKM